MLTILGGGGWFPAHGRHTATALLRTGDEAIMIDSGTGVSRLIERPELLEGVESLDILLTHFHLDHVVGLAYLPAIGMCPQTRVWGPGRLLYGCPTFDLLSRLTHEPIHPVPLEDQDIEVRDFDKDEIELAGVRVTMRRQDRHTAPTLGFRFDDQLAWITDTAYDPDSAAFAEGCEMLAHEAWFTNAAPRNVGIHSSGQQAAQIAEEAGIERLLLIHLPPFEADVEPIVAEARTLAPLVETAREGMGVAVFVA